MPVRSGCSTNPRSAVDVCSLTNDRVSLSVSYNQPYSNVMGHLDISEFHNGIILPGERKLYIMGSAPSERAKHTFLPDLTVDECLCWTHEDKPLQRFVNADLADKAVQMFLELCQRAQRGEIDTTSEFYRKTQRQKWLEHE